MEDCRPSGGLRSASAHRGAADRSVSPPLIMQPMTFLAPQAGTPALPGNSTPSSTQGRGMAAPPQPLRPAPRSVSPLPRYGQCYNGQLVVPGPIATSAWTAVAQQGRQVSVPRQRPDTIATATARGIVA